MDGGEGVLAVTLADLRRVTEVGLEKANGQLSLVVQRLDQAEERSNHFAQRADSIEGRLSTLERTAITSQRFYTALTAIAVVIGTAAAVLGLWLGG
jgi:hypothetical protein